MLSSTMSASDNHAQQQYWNEPGGEAWIEWEHHMDLQHAPLATRLLKRWRCSLASEF